MNISEVKALAHAIRKGILELSQRGHTAHIGSCLSCADILAAVYGGGLNISPDNVTSPDRDRLLLGKGHAAVALLATLAERGFFPHKMLDDFNRSGSTLQEHPGPDWPTGVEIAAGSLGHALPIAVGLALAVRIRDRKSRICAVIGDGECNEGSVWEAAMFAGGQRLANLCVVVDANCWQAIGRCCDINALDPLPAKWEVFGWRAVEVNGHDVEALRETLRSVGDVDKPTAIVARTIKGKGVSFMEDDNNWHYRLLSDKELEKALSEIDELQ